MQHELSGQLGQTLPSAALMGGLVLMAGGDDIFLRIGISSMNKNAESNGVKTEVQTFVNDVGFGIPFLAGKKLRIVPSIAFASSSTQLLINNTGASAYTVFGAPLLPHTTNAYKARSQYGMNASVEFTLPLFNSFKRNYDYRLGFMLSYYLPFSYDDAMINGSGVSKEQLDLKSGIFNFGIVLTLY
jgi:hypothetical protein